MKTKSKQTCEISRGSAGTEAGFTLVELLVCLIVIAILFGLLFPALAAIRQKSWDVRARDLCGQAVTGWSAILFEHKRFPPPDEINRYAGGNANTVRLSSGDYQIGMDNKSLSLVNWWNPKNPQGEWTVPHGVGYQGTALVMQENVNKPVDLRLERTPDMIEWGMIAPWVKKNLGDRSGKESNSEGGILPLVTRATIIVFIDSDGDGKLTIPAQYGGEKINASVAACVWNGPESNPKSKLIKTW